MRRLPIGTVIDNEISGIGYRIKEHLGRGGFGDAYRAVRLSSRGGEAADPVCLKLSPRADTWHGEAYFAGLLSEVSNVVRMTDAFPTRVRDGRASRMVFAIEMEYFPDGTIRDACKDGRLPWTEDQVQRRTRMLLKPLSLLHAMGASHRDITPGNIFVGNRSVLKLGDFGITKAGLKPSGVRADLAAWAFAPHDLGAWWRPADDVYQVGLLMMTLLTGEEMTNGTKKPSVNKVTSRDSALRGAIKAAISVKSRRPQAAGDLEDMLR